ncbi:hypothetical protein [Thalassotalea agariperforans]
MNYLGNIAGQLNNGTKKLDHSQATLAALLGMSGITGDVIDKIPSKGELMKYLKEAVAQFLNSKLLELEGKKKC